MASEVSSLDDIDESGIEEIIRICDQIFDQIPLHALVNGADKKLIEAQNALIHAICKAENIYLNEKRRRREVEGELGESKQEVMKLKTQLSLLKGVEKDNVEVLN